MNRLLLSLLATLLAGLFLSSPLAAQNDDTMTPDASDSTTSDSHDQAIADLTQAIQANPQNAQAYFQRAYLYMETDKGDQAIADLSQAIQIKPKFAQAYFRRSFVYLMKGSFDQAVADLNQAIQINPQFAKAYYRRACVEMIQGKDDPAIADLTKLIQMNPDFAQAYVRRGYAYMLKGDYARAIAELDQFIQGHPNGGAAYSHLAWLLATCPQANIRDGKKAVEDATQACNIAGWKASEQLDTLAAACAEAGDFASAVKWENEAISNQNVEELVADQKSRLALYQASKPYRVAKYDPEFQVLVR